MPINYSEYECSYCDADSGTFHAISRGADDVVIIPKLEVLEGKLVCEYRSLDASLTEDDLKGLIFVSLLGRFMKRYYIGKVKFVQFHNILSGEKSESVYI